MCIQHDILFFDRRSCYHTSQVFIPCWQLSFAPLWASSLPRKQRRSSSKPPTFWAARCSMMNSTASLFPGSFGLNPSTKTVPWYLNSTERVDEQEITNGCETTTKTTTRSTGSTRDGSPSRVNLRKRLFDALGALRGWEEHRLGDMPSQVYQLGWHHAQSELPALGSGPQHRARDRRK